MGKIEDPKALRDLYPAPGARALAKEVRELDAHCTRFIALSPFCVMGSATNAGDPDLSPRGGAPGFAKVRDSRTILMADRPGNNRLDSLSKLAANPRIALLFLVPGLDETLRVFGTAEIVAGADFGNDLISNGRAPQTVLKIAVWTIKDGRDGRDLATGRLLTTAPVQDGDAAGSVALSQNLGEMSRQIAERIVELNAIPKPRAPLTSKAVD